MKFEAAGFLLIISQEYNHVCGSSLRCLVTGSVVSRNHPIGWSSRDVTEGHVLPIVFDLQMQSTSRHGDRLAMAMYVLRIPMAGAT